MVVFKSQAIYNFRSMIICQVSARKYQCRVQVITDSFLQRLENSTKTSVTIDDLSGEIYTQMSKLQTGKVSTRKVLPLLLLYCLDVLLAPSFTHWIIFHCIRPVCSVCLLLLSSFGNPNILENFSNAVHQHCSYRDLKYFRFGLLFLNMYHPKQKTGF